MSKRHRPRFKDHRIEDSRAADHAYVLAHRDEYRVVRLRDEYSAEELAALLARVQGYVASGAGRVRSTWE